ncbi:hypothetical protein OOK39_21970 [Streptomyces sp. NBC_00264]|uniref:hypothetical protein n=1 Tax=unclassified Streptomyces TaxID=2593676 RepID=UPI002259232E|nr:MULTISPECIES: hypothetical protein [unclassified Streptomyces]MCX5161913.1 hypothetical protein [Streptomyces sp. NBC_00305]MCX5220430.1 hypothetical protein [Streptomyces sp. NBC_00264]
MIGRTTPAIALGLFLLGIGLGLVGILDEGDSITRAGIVLSVASFPPLIIWQSQRAHQLADDQLAETHAAGYRLALEHVAAGLLDDSTAPPDGGAHVEPNEAKPLALAGDRAAASSDVHSIGNVRQLHPVHHTEPDTEQVAL